jgi:hypothetical protein
MIPPLPLPPASNHVATMEAMRLITAAAAAAVGRVGTFHNVIIVRQNTVQLMTAIMFHVTNLTTPGSGSDNPSSQNTVQLMTASMFHVTNPTPPGSDNPAVKTLVDDSQYIPCNQSDTPRE